MRGWQNRRLVNSVYDRIMNNGVIKHESLIDDMQLPADLRNSQDLSPVAASDAFPN